MFMRKIKLFFRAVILPGLIICLTFFAGCDVAPKPKRPLPLSGDGMEASRADPGYMQYLDRQSMLAHAGKLAQIVSGSNMNWRHPASSPTPEKLLRQADVWMYVHPQNVLGSNQINPLQQIANPIFWSVLNRVGVNGLYIAPTGGSGSMWDHDRRFALESNEDIIQFTFAKNIGKEEDYANIIRQSQAANCLLGGDILPLASGVGPDFFLASRNLRNYPSLFSMIEVPKALWGDLPPVNQTGDEWQTIPLLPENVSALALRGFIPEKMQQDYLPYVGQSGWAATGEVRCNDGNLRRWVYRWAYNYKRPLLNIYDPAQTARQVLSGSIIYQVGILGNSMTGYRVAPLFGLESSESSQGYIANHSAYTAGFALAADISRQVRAYGGWGMLKDELPVPLLRQALQSGPDVARDSITSPAAEHALLTGDKKLLEFMLDEAVRNNIDFRRLIHMSSGPYGIDYTLPHLLYLKENEDMANSGNHMAGQMHTQVMEQAALAATSPETGESQFSGSLLCTTPAGVAALGAGIYQNSDVNSDTEEEIRRGHMLLQFFKIMQPGIYMLSGQDLAGTMPLEESTITSNPGAWNKQVAPMGTYALISSAESYLVSSLGIPKAKSIYGAFDAQAYNPGSAATELGGLMRLRKQSGISRGTYSGRLNTKGRGLTALVSRLPQDSAFAAPDAEAAYLISICNFDRAESEEIISLADIPELSELTGRIKITMLYGDTSNVYQHQNRILFIAPRWSKALLLLKVLPEQEDTTQQTKAMQEALIKVPNFSSIQQ